MESVNVFCASQEEETSRSNAPLEKEKSGAFSEDIQGNNKKGKQERKRRNPSPLRKRKEATMQMEGLSNS